jgi:hypothetical protein
MPGGGRLGKKFLRAAATPLPLASIDRETVFRAKRMSLGVGGIAMRGYNMKGLDIASHELLDCYRQHGTNR